MCEFFILSIDNTLKAFQLEKANRRLHQQKLQLWQQFKKTKEELEKYRDDYDALLHQVLTYDFITQYLFSVTVLLTTDFLMRPKSMRR